MDGVLGVLMVTLWLQLTGVNSQLEEEKSWTLNIQEGENITMNCSYNTFINALQWYRQDSGRGPAMLILIRTNEREKRSGRLRVTLNPSAQSSSLSITAAQAADSAVYFCATTTAGVGKLTFGTGTRLLVSLDIQDPKPAVYQLRDPHSKDDTICLFTDFDSRVNVSKDVSSEVFVSDKTVLDMRIMGSKSNGALAWSNQSSFDCKEAFKENASYPSSDVPCDAKLVEKSFQTDMNLNFQNLSVMGLRILLLKVAGFNLFMTLRLWSS